MIEAVTQLRRLIGRMIAADTLLVGLDVSRSVAAPLISALAAENSTRSPRLLCSSASVRCSVVKRASSNA